MSFNVIRPIRHIDDTDLLGGPNGLTQDDLLQSGGTDKVLLSSGNNENLLQANGDLLLLSGGTDKLLISGRFIVVST